MSEIPELGSIAANITMVVLTILLVSLLKTMLPKRWRAEVYGFFVAWVISAGGWHCVQNQPLYTVFSKRMIVASFLNALLIYASAFGVQLYMSHKTDLPVEAGKPRSTEAEFQSGDRDAVPKSAHSKDRISLGRKIMEFFFGEPWV